MKLQFLSKSNSQPEKGIPQDEVDFKIFLGIDYLVQNSEKMITAFSGENYMIVVKRTINYEFIVDVYNAGEKYRLGYSILPEIGSPVAHSDSNVVGEVIDVDYENDEITINWEQLPPNLKNERPKSKIPINHVRTIY